MGNSMSSHRKPPPPPPRRVPLLALLILLKYGPAPAGAGRPRVTAALIAANALMYYRPRPGELDAHLPRLQDVTFNPHLIIKLLSKALLLLGYKTPYYQFSAGFSGVVLGMNVVLNSRAANVVCFGVVIPSKYVAWLELLLVQASNPKAHLTGNVGGILAGLAYLWLNRGTRPFALMFSGIADIVSQPVRFARRLLRSPTRHRGSSVQDNVASVPREIHGRWLQRFGTGHGMWRCTTCCRDNSPTTDVCKMCNSQHQDHGFSCRQLLQDGGTSELSVEEIRRRRLQRFEN